MERPDIVTLETFVAVVEAQGFTRAAERLETTAGAVSRRVSALEAHLGLRLLNRTTRRFSLTEAGEHYFRDVSVILQALTEAQDRVSHLAEAPGGNLRVAAPLSFGVRALAPLLPAFLARYPDLHMTLDLDDRLVDILATGADLALRIGTLTDSSLVARRITEFRRILCAAPSYLGRRGEPQTPTDLAGHACLHYSNLAPRDEWTLMGPKGPETVVVSGPLCANNGDLLRQAAIAGLGIVALPDFLVGDDLAAGHLVPILTAYGTAKLACSALWPSRQFVPAKVRVFVEFLAETLGGGQRGI